LNGRRAPAALANVMGVYWIRNGIVLFHDSLLARLASAWAFFGGAVLISDAPLIRRRLPAHQGHPAGSTFEERAR